MEKCLSVTNKLFGFSVLRWRQVVSLLPKVDDSWPTRKPRTMVGSLSGNIQNSSRRKLAGLIVKVSTEGAENYFLYVNKFVAAGGAKLVHVGRGPLAVDSVLPVTSVCSQLFLSLCS